MDPLGAREILQALVQGFDPVSGAELPAGTVVHHAEVIRALLAGITALEADAQRTRRRAQLPENVGRPWRAAAEEELAAAFRAGEPLPAIAARHRRTVAAIEARLEHLGLLAPEQRTTRNRYVTRGEPSSVRTRSAPPPSASPSSIPPSSAPPSSAPPPSAPSHSPPPQAAPGRPRKGSAGA